MITARMTTQGLPEVWQESNENIRVRADFPLSAEKGSMNTAAVYFELEPGRILGRHTDSAEEVLIILEGTVEVTVGEETGQVSAGELALVPEMVPHSMKNVGSSTARVAGIFSQGHIQSTFDEPWMPMNQRIFEF